MSGILDALISFRTYLDIESVKYNTSILALSSVGVIRVTPFNVDYSLNFSLTESSISARN